jgi:2-polyprenyl-3-methyl-5-hydroxy-6-metoxy-1,4-benzoquinol methylase
MYKKIKNILIKLFNKDFIIKNELILRNLYGFFYSGRNFQCTICNKKLRKFIDIFEDDLMCPNCGSLARTRRLQSILLQDFLVNQSVKILDFSPPRCRYRKLKKNTQIDYVSTDYAGEFMSDKQLNIVNIDEPDNRYDLIVCYHILEHIKEDKKAISELFRIMKPGGRGIIQTPFKDGDIYEDDSIKTEAERRIHFGQEDHVRVYSVSGLCERLEKAGFVTKSIKYHDKHPNFYGFRHETVIFIEKVITP